MLVTDVFFEFSEKQMEEEEETIVTRPNESKTFLPNSLDKDVVEEGEDVGLKATLFGLRLSYLVFSVGKEPSRTLQSKDCNMQEAINSSSLTSNYYKRMRSEKEFNVFYDRILKESEGKTKAPFLAQQRKAPA